MLIQTKVFNELAIKPVKLPLSLKFAIRSSHRGWQASVAVLLALALTGCQTMWPDRQPLQSQKSQSKQEQAQEAIAASATTQRNLRLLAEAEQALTRKRLTTPVDDNAYLRYLQVLASDPDNATALDGLNRIVETYVAWAIMAIENNRLSHSKNLLNKARSVDDAHPSIAAVDRRIQAAQAQQSEAHYLSPTELRQRSSRIAKQLRELAKLSASKSSRIRITAKTDADGRWIYQQMNQATDKRIRATINIGPDPIVQLIYP